MALTACKEHFIYFCNNLFSLMMKSDFLLGEMGRPSLDFTPFKDSNLNRCFVKPQLGPTGTGDIIN